MTSRKNLRKLEGSAGKNATELLEIANKVCQSQPNSTPRSRKEDEAKSGTLGSCPVKALPHPRPLPWDRPIRQGAQVRKGAFPSAVITGTIARKRDTGKRSALAP